MTTIKDLAEFKRRGQKWAMLTSYEMTTAEIFDEAGIPVLLVGDSAGNNFYGDSNTIPVTVDELLPLARAVARSVKQALVVADLPFGSYEAGPDQALATSIRFFKEAGAHAVKLEGAHLDAIKKLVTSGIPVMGHIGLTPQSVHQLGGFKVQGRENPEALIEAAKSIEKAGAFAIVLEMVPEELAGRITEALSIPTIGIGAGKSLAADYFLSLGAKVIDADQLARQAIERGSAGFDEVIAKFGDSILKDGEIDRRALGEIVFSDENKRKTLEAIIHPRVQQALSDARKNLNVDEILIYEIPLLVETNAAAKFDMVITVEAPLDARIARLRSRGLHISEIEKRIASQATPEMRKAIANIVIDNEGNEEQLLRKVEAIWEELNASSN